MLDKYPIGMGCGEKPRGDFERSFGSELTFPHGLKPQTLTTIHSMKILTFLSTSCFKVYVIEERNGKILF